jgi:hypothetical protein
MVAALDCGNMERKRRDLNIIEEQQWEVDYGGIHQHDGINSMIERKGGEEATKMG